MISNLFLPICVRSKKKENVGRVAGKEGGKGKWKKTTKNLLVRLESITSSSKSLLLVFFFLCTCNAHRKETRLDTNLIFMWSAEFHLGNLSSFNQLVLNFFAQIDTQTECTNTWKNSNMQEHMNTHTHTHTYLRTHTHTHTCTHKQAEQAPLL